MQQAVATAVEAVLGVPSDSRQEPCDDLALVRAFVGGDERAFDRLVARHSQAVARLAHRLLGWARDGHEVDDVVQEVFLRAYRGLRRFRSQSSVSTWLFRVTVNECRSRRRARVRRWLGPSGWTSDDEVARAPEAVGPADDRRVAEQQQRVRDAVGALAPKYREVVVLRYLEGLPVVRVAAIVGRSRNCVEARLSRARVMLKGRLGAIED